MSKQEPPYWMKYSQLIILIFATFWGVYEFIYKDIIKPSNRPSALKLSAEITEQGTKASMRMVRIQLTTTNPTDRRIYIPAYWFEVKGIILNKSAEKTVQTDKQASTEEMQTLYSAIEKQDMVAQKMIVSEGLTWWEPKDLTHDEFMFTIPENTYDYLQLHVKYLSTRETDGMNTPRWQQLPDSSWNAQFVVDGIHSDLELLEWQRKTSSGYNWHTKVLPLWPKK